MQPVCHHSSLLTVRVLDNKSMKEGVTLWMPCIKYDPSAHLLASPTTTYSDDDLDIQH